MTAEFATQQTELPRRREPRAVAQTNKRRGAMVERVVADYLAHHTGLPVERRRLEGVNDRGDLAGIAGVVVEIKSGQPQLRAWLRETEKERVNARAQIGVLWWAPPGLAKQPDRHVIIAPASTAYLLFADTWTCVPLRVPAAQIEWHTSHGHRYHVEGVDACAVSGRFAATKLGWAGWRTLGATQ